MTLVAVTLFSGIEHGIFVLNMVYQGKSGGGNEVI